MKVYNLRDDREVLVDVDGTGKLKAIKAGGSLDLPAEDARRVLHSSPFLSAQRKEREAPAFIHDPNDHTRRAPVAVVVRHGLEESTAATGQTDPGAPQGNAPGNDDAGASDPEVVTVPEAADLSWVDELKGADLDTALKAAELSTDGKVEEKRARLREHHTTPAS